MLQNFATVQQQQKARTTVNQCFPNYQTEAEFFAWFLIFFRQVPGQRYSFSPSLCHVWNSYCFRIFHLTFTCFKTLVSLTKRIFFKIVSIFGGSSYMNPKYNFVGLGNNNYLSSEARSSSHQNWFSLKFSKSRLYITKSERSSLLVGFSPISS